MNVVNTSDLVNVSWEARKSGFIAGVVVGGVSALWAYRKMKKMEAKLADHRSDQ